MTTESDPGRDALLDLAGAQLDDPEAAAAVRAAATAALALLTQGPDRAELLARAMDAVDPREAAAHALAAALSGIAAPDAGDAIATFVGVVTGALGGVANVALADPGTGAVRHLLAQSSPDPSASGDQRMGELFVAGTLTRVAAHHVTLEEGLAVLDGVARAAREVDELDVDALLRHVFGPLEEVDLEEPASRAALLGGAVTLAAVPRITGGLLSGDVAVQRKGWARAAALLVDAGRLAGAPMDAADTQAGAARMASDPRLLGDPATTITDLLTTVLGLQAARVLGGVGSTEPVGHLVARLVAHTALADSGPA
jgi:hypothetical protein